MADHNGSTDVSTTPLPEALDTNHHVSHVCMHAGRLDTCTAVLGVSSSPDQELDCWSREVSSSREEREADPHCAGK